MDFRIDILPKLIELPDHAPGPFSPASVHKSREEERRLLTIVPASRRYALTQSRKPNPFNHLTAGFKGAS